MSDCPEQQLLELIFRKRPFRSGRPGDYFAHHLGRSARSLLRPEAALHFGRMLPRS
jgi:hypothetical protein